MRKDRQAEAIWHKFRGQDKDSGKVVANIERIATEAERRLDSGEFSLTVFDDVGAELEILGYSTFVVAIVDLLSAAGWPYAGKFREWHRIESADDADSRKAKREELRKADDQERKNTTKRATYRQLERLVALIFLGGLFCGLALVLYGVFVSSSSDLMVVGVGVAAVSVVLVFLAAWIL